MIDKAKRVLALLLMLLLLSGVVRPGNFILLTAYASDEIVEDSGEEVADDLDLNDEEEFADDVNLDDADDPTDNPTDDPIDDPIDDPGNDPGNDPAIDPTDDPDDPALEDEETADNPDALFEASGDYVSVCITGICPSDLQPEASPVTIQDNEQVCVLEAWSVDNLSEDCCLSLTAKIIALPELGEREILSFAAVNGETIVSNLDELRAEGDTQELELAKGSVTGIALVKQAAESEEDEKLYTAEDPLWANDDLYLTGRMPKNAVATAEPVTVSIDGEEVLAAWDIKIYSDADKVGTDEVWQPADDMIQIHLRSEAFGGLDGKLNVYHMEDAESEAELVGTAESEADWVSFNAESFSLYVVSIVIDKTITATDGNTYKITVTYDDGSEIPVDAQLQVRELIGEEYEDYLGRTAVLMKAAGFGFARIFDITIVDAGGKECQPGKPVSVKIQLLNLDAEGASEDYSVVHFGEKAEEIGAQTDGNTVSFSAESFSAYAIVDAPDPLPAEWEQIVDLATFDEYLGQELYMGHSSGCYFRDTTYVVKGTRTGILKTTPVSATPPAAAVPYYCEKTADGKYKFYWTDANTRHYVKGTSDSLSFTDEASATAFTVIANGDGTWQVKVGNGWWNQQGSSKGKGFAIWTENNEDSRIVFWHQEVNASEDPYGFDGKKYGLMNWSGGTSGKAMMADAAPNGMLQALALTVMTHKNNDEDRLFVPKDSDITMWTFHWLGEDHYALSAEIDGSTKYLTISAEGLALSNTPCEIQVVPGTGIHAGEAFLRANGYTLTYSGNVEQGFGVGGAVGSEWLHLVNLSELTSDYFMVYSAEKVSVSETPNDERIIVYTRVWNSSSEKYELYAVDHDGTLVPCFESGDSIQWVGSMINTMLWKFSEYYWEGTTDPTFYYDLYNEYEDQFIAPQLSVSQILQDEAIGINLDGRQSGYYSTTIMAWDDGSYAYVGLKADMTTGKVVPCPIDEAEHFFFAIVHDLPVDDELTTVRTVEHQQYGISMKIKDIDTRAEMSNFLGSDAGGIGTALHQGLLSDTLASDGYPTAAGGSLGTLMSGARVVDHLFIESTYQSSGYYEYDSTQNFASLQDDNNFVVYKELATYDNAGGRPSLKHGQFYPFNSIEPGAFAATNGKNQYDANGQALPDNDPRKNERLYLIKNPDYYFAVEIEASFTQTPNGLDAWNHDIKYEFTGDDDFWLYVDGILVIDLGGIHSAVPGSVNYRTGSVNVNGVPTTLYDIFSQYLSAEELAETFEPNDQGQMVFKDNSTHTMKIFYMERGAGASNLHMRFNLASTKPGTVELSKKLSGVDTTESVLASFPYQIWYKTADNEEHLYTDANHVCFKDTIRRVPYKESMTIGGIDYDSVFLLKPGETAVIELPEDAVEYKIVECSVSTQVFSQVKVNDTMIQGTEVSDQRCDFAIPYASSGNRARVIYDNKVDTTALRTLSFTKKLFDETGETELTSDEDSTPFAFRLYLGAEFDETPVEANKHSYHIKDPSGYYCTWNQTLGRLEATGWNDFSAIPTDQRASVTFHTSLYGQISMIPTGYTVEVRSVLAGTQFRVVERPTDMPDGYSFQKYVYTDAQGQHEYTDAGVGVEDQIRPDEDPEVDICNLRGWGLRVNKIWTDADYMEERADTYFAVFTDNGSGSLTLVEDTVRRLKQNESTLYWYFLPLPVQGVSFQNYLIREIRISSQNPTVDTDGKVTNYGTVTIIEDGATIAISGRQKGETTSSDFNYTVQYQKGDISDDSNVRVDTVMNNRPGVVLRKVDWSGNPMAETSFTLTDSDDSLIGSFTSDESGQITVAFLRENVDYTLTETKTPQGITGLAPMTVRFSGSTVSVSGVNEIYYTIIQVEGEMPVLTIKNRPYVFQAIKQSANGDSLAGAHFALHKQKTVDGVTIIETNPMEGYEDLVTDAQGIVPLLDNTLSPGTYELRETNPPGGYSPLPAYIRFTVSPIGEISLGTHPEGVELSRAEPSQGPISFTLIIPNDMGLPAPTNYDGAAHTDGYRLLLAAGMLLALISLLPALFRRRRGARSS